MSKRIKALFTEGIYEIRKAETAVNALAPALRSVLCHHCLCKNFENKYYNCVSMY